MTAFRLLPPRDQQELQEQPYDYWVNPAGGRSAEFFSRSGAYLVRFPDQADFEIAGESLAVSCALVPGEPQATAQTLFQNSIRPIIGNHKGELNLHGSAVAIDNFAVAFLGQSRRGKTTLAGAFSKAGYPYLTEDVLQVRSSEDSFHLVPHRTELRVFPDSASFLAGRGLSEDLGDVKIPFPASDSLPFCQNTLPLSHIFILGEGRCEAVHIAPIGQAEGIRQLLQQSFILDVEDRVRLRSHFWRLGALAAKTPCFELDYPRAYHQLPLVIAAISRFVASGKN